MVKNLSEVEKERNGSKPSEIYSNEDEEDERNAIIKIFTSNPVLIMHLFLYLSVIGLLSLIWILDRLQGTVADYWPMNTIFGWGFGIAIHSLTYLTYNDKNKWLSKVRHQSDFGVLFVYHFLLYSLINLYLIILNVIYTPKVLWFVWPLALWGIGVGLHALGFFSWKNIFNKEINKLREKYKDERYRDDYPEKRLKKMVNKKISHLWLLLADITYFAVINALLVNLIPFVNQFESLIIWAIVVGLHAFAYILAYHINMKSIVKGLVFNIVLFGAILGLVIYQVVQGLLTANWILYLIIFWGIIFGIHIIIAKKWDSFKVKTEDTISTMSTSSGFDLDSFEVKSRASSLLIWQWSFVAHLIVYGVGLLIISLELANAGLELSLLIHPAMGWLVAVAIHGAIYIAVRFQILELLPITAMIHVAIYAVICIYLAILNPIVAVITAAGWGIGLGLHVLVAFLTR